MRSGQKKLLALIAAKLVLYLVLPAYVFFRIYFMVFTDADFVARAFSATVFIIECYFITQTAGYLLNFVRSVKNYPRFLKSLQRDADHDIPSVAVFIPVYNEPPEVVAGTVEAARGMDYRNKEIYILDDSDRPDIRASLESIARRHRAHLIRRKSRSGYKAGALNEAIAATRSDYVMVLDSDQLADRAFLSKLVPLMEGDKRLAYVQTPQNVRGLSKDGFIDRGAATTQSVFYNHVCEGKGIVNAQFSCGSNVLYRREALESIERKQGDRTIYMDEWSVTEDYATSILLQEKGWGSLYYTGTSARGLVPATLEAFSAQRKRWAVGTLSVFFRYAPKMLFGRFSMRQRWEYLSAGSYFLLGVANFLMLVNIAVLIAFNIPTYATFLPPLLFVSNMVTFYYSQHIRGNNMKDLFYEQVLNYLIFPTYVEAFLTVVLGRKVAFAVTSKSRQRSGPPALLIQEAALLCCFGLLFIGVNDYAASPSYYILLNLFWLVYAMMLLAVGITLVRKESRAQAAIS